MWNFPLPLKSPQLTDGWCKIVQHLRILVHRIMDILDFEFEHIGKRYNAPHENSL